MASVVRPYKLRKSWEDTKTQKSSYAHLNSAIKAVDALYSEGNYDYLVWKDGEVVYGVEKEDSDEVIPASVINQLPDDKEDSTAGESVDIVEEEITSEDPVAPEVCEEESSEDTEVSLEDRHQLCDCDPLCDKCSECDCGCHATSEETKKSWWQRFIEAVARLFSGSEAP